MQSKLAINRDDIIINPNKASVKSPDPQQLTTSSNSSTEEAGLNVKNNQIDQSEKVSRCFGNCMPSNLLCFKVGCDLIFKLIFIILV